MNNPPHGSIITVLNLKGGVGKTHASWLIAAVCQERERSLLLIDTDAQGNLTSSFLPETDRRPGIELAFDPASEESLVGLIRRTTHSAVSIIPGGPALVSFDLADQRQWEKADLHLTLTDAIQELRPHYDYIVIDCPPRLSLVSFAALCASDFVIIPMEAADWGAQGIMQVTEAVEYVQKHYNPRLQLLGYLVSRFKRARKYQKNYLQQLRAHFGDLAFDTVIPDLARFEQSVTDRIPITIHSPRSEAADIARRFFDEVECRTQGLRTGRPGRRQADIRQPAIATA